MKYWIKWIIAAVIVALLFVRMIYKLVTRSERERDWYASELHYDFSARIDSMLYSGVALIDVTRGEVDHHREYELRSQLKANGDLWVMVPQNGKYNFRVPYAAKKGDSVSVNSDQDILSLYRDDELIVSRPFKVSIRNSPF